MSAESDFIGDAVRKVYDYNYAVVALSADFLADKVMEMIAGHDFGFDKYSHAIGWFGCKQHVKQAVRSHLRHSCDPDRDDRQGDIFPEMLQDRYPSKPMVDVDWSDALSDRQKPESQYILRDHLSEEDRWWNIDQLRKSANARVKHANALQAETILRYGPRRGL